MVIEKGDNERTETKEYKVLVAVSGSKDGKVYYGAKARSNSGPACNRS